MPMFTEEGVKTRKALHGIAVQGFASDGWG
jgi:hypothetical protein